MMFYHPNHASRLVDGRRNSQSPASQCLSFVTTLILWLFSTEVKPVNGHTL